MMAVPAAHERFTLQRFIFVVIQPRVSTHVRLRLERTVQPVSAPPSAAPTSGVSAL